MKKDDPKQYPLSQAGFTQPSRSGKRAGIPMPLIIGVGLLLCVCLAFFAISRLFRGGDAENPTEVDAFPSEEPIDSSSNDDLFPESAESDFSGGDASVTLINETAEDVCYVFISSAGADSWGEDWLGAEDLVQTDEQIQFELEPGVYDFQARDCEDNILSEDFDIPIESGELIEWPIE